jgi:hypothetical protein
MPRAVCAGIRFNRRVFFVMESVARPCHSQVGMTSRSLNTEQHLGEGCSGERPTTL